MANVKVILENIVENGRAVKNMAGDYDRLDKSTGNASGGFKNLASKAAVAAGALGGAYIAAQQAYQFLGEGAQLELARSKFENLAVSIDTTADSLLGKLRTATKGMQTDAELIAGATDIINLGLGETEEDVTRLATVIGGLGLDMQQVILTFANNSTMRLDALGLSVEGVTQKAKELEDQGFDGDAFDEAVLISLEEKMTLLGDASETTAGRMQQLEADWKNLKDEGKLLVAEALGPVVGLMADLASGREDVEQQFKDANALARDAITLDEYIDLLREANIAFGDRSVAEYWFNQEKLAQAVDSADRAMLGLNARLTENEPFVAGAARANEELADKIQQTGNRMSEAEAFIHNANIRIRETGEEAVTAKTLYEEYMGGFESEVDMTASETVKGELLRQKMLLEEALALQREIAEDGSTKQHAENARTSYQEIGSYIRTNGIEPLGKYRDLLDLPPVVSTQISVDVSGAMSEVDRLLNKLAGIGGPVAGGVGFGGGNPDMAQPEPGTVTGTGQSTGGSSQQTVIINNYNTQTTNQLLQELGNSH